jgi:hypothetical protein
MTVTEIVDEVQAQLLSAVQTVQENVVGTLVWLTEQAETVLPETTIRLANSLPRGSTYVDRGFATAEQWLRSQHDFASKIAEALKPSA